MTIRDVLWICLLVSMQPGVSGQCTDTTTFTYDYSDVARIGGNSIRGYSQTSTYGNYASYWQPYLSTTWSRNGIVLANYSNDTNPTGVTISRTYTSTLQTYGPGSYQISASHNHWNKVC
jgi:hypothetical protein